MPSNPFLNSIQQLTLASIPQLQQAECFLSAHNIISTFLQGILSALLTAATCRLTSGRKKSVSTSDLQCHFVALWGKWLWLVLVKGTNKFRWGDNVLTCWPEWGQDFSCFALKDSKTISLASPLPHHCYFTKAVTGLDTMVVCFSYLGDRGGCEAHWR